MQTGDQTSSTRTRSRRLRLLLLATAGAVFIGDLAGAERAAGAAASHSGPAAGAAIAGAHDRRSEGTARLTNSRGPAPAGSFAPTPTTVAAPKIGVSQPAPTAAAPAPPVPHSVPAAPHPQPAPAGPASAAPPMPKAATPATKPGAPAPATPAPKPAPSPKPAPAPTPSPAPLSTPPDPAASIPPDQDFQQACWTPSPDLRTCDQAALADIDHARSQEGLGPLNLPADYYSLPVPAQLIAVANAERTSRGLPAMAENSSWDTYAQRGAAAGQDPTGPGGYTWDSNWVVGDPTGLSADYSWMYDDGPGSQNVDCTASNHGGCWGHRHDILSPWYGSAGAGVASYQGRTSMTELFVKTP